MTFDEHVKINLITLDLQKELTDELIVISKQLQSLIISIKPKTSNLKPKT